MQEEICKFKVLRIIGLSPEEVKKVLGGDIAQSENLKLNLINFPNGTIDLEIRTTAKVERMAQALLSAVEQQLRQKFQDNIYGMDGEKLEEVVGYLLYLRGLTIAVAESCTGGLLSNKLTDIPGSSLYYRGGIIAYGKDVKIELLNIPTELIEKCGIVSQEVATSMAKGISQVMKTNIGVGITGYAGPEGEDVGLVYIGIYSEGNLNTKEFKFTGQREEIKEKAVYAALDMVRRELLKW